jgi:Flp pilus assembly protein TadB
MAQTKRKRRSKHRGTAAGTIETRGRTGRPPTAEERKKQAKMSARERRLNTPPTWKSSLTRASFAAMIMFVFLLLTTKGKKGGLEAALVFALLALVLYVPSGYYLELYLYRRRQRKKETGG